MNINIFVAKMCIRDRLYFATDDFVKSFAYFAMMIADNKPHPRLMLEHVTGEIPVSYTHLDVYKRQMKYRPVRAVNWL